MTNGDATGGKERRREGGRSWTSRAVESPLTREVIAAAIEVHRVLGPGLLESIYEGCLEHELRLRGFQVERQRPVAIEYKGLRFNQELRFDLLVEGQLLVELKCVASLKPVHSAQVLSYMRLLDVPMGLIFNFHGVRLTDDMARLDLPTTPSRPPPLRPDAATLHILSREFSRGERELAGGKEKRRLPRSR